MFNRAFFNFEEECFVKRISVDRIIKNSLFYQFRDI